MIFSTPEFFIFFATLCIILLFSRNNTYRKSILLLGSYFFYAAWDVRYLSLIFLSSLLDFVIGLKMSREARPNARKRLLVISMCLNLGVLGVFKYLNFFIDSFIRLFNLETVGTLNIILPVGISFFTFQTMSYTIDLYRRKIDACHSWLDFLLFVSFFPQLVAGPIVRAIDFLPQLNRAIEFNRQNMARGSLIFLAGMIQKVVFADNIAIFVDRVYDNIGIFSYQTILLASASYAIQIFCDFSGYSMMAIGIAKFLGFDLPKNFNYPYMSRSIVEFWHRWHISLSTWLRDYLYISLGGNIGGNVKKYINIMVTMALGGLWHGAGWNFVCWGILHGFALVLNHEFTRLGMKTHRILGFFMTLIFVVLMWIPFRSPNFDVTTEIFIRILTFDAGVLWLHPSTIAALIGVVIWHFGHFLLENFPWAKGIMRIFPSRESNIILALTMILIILVFGQVEISPFIYFQF